MHRDLSINVLKHAAATTAALLLILHSQPYARQTDELILSRNNDLKGPKLWVHPRVINDRVVTTRA